MFSNDDLTADILAVSAVPYKQILSTISYWNISKGTHKKAGLHQSVRLI